MAWASSAVGGPNKVIFDVSNCFWPCMMGSKHRNGVPLWIAPHRSQRRAAPPGCRFTTPHYGHLIIQMAVYVV